MLMKVKIIKKKDTTILKIDGVTYGKGITGYEIKQDACNRPILTLHCIVDELGFECNDCEIENVKDK